MGAKEGRDPHERVRPRWVRNEVAGDRQKFVREGELTGEMGGATDFKGGTIWEGKGYSRKGFGRKER